MIDAKGKVRVIPYATMFGRPTANARHLTNPENKIYYASMEEALYEVDVHTLKVTPLFYDEAENGKEPKANLKLKANGDDQAWTWLQQYAAIPSRSGILSVDAR